jgi:hypothetical protein
VPRQAPFKCKECGTVLPDKEHLRKHQHFHKEAAWKEQGYVDPNNRIFPSMTNYTNSRLAFFVSNILGTNEVENKRKKTKKKQTG